MVETLTAHVQHEHHLLPYHHIVFCCLHYAVRLADTYRISTLKMEAKCSSKVLALTHKITWSDYDFSVHRFCHEFCLDPLQPRNQ
jgi:hypothetical protein